MQFAAPASSVYANSMVSSSSVASWSSIFCVIAVKAVKNSAALYRFFGSPVPVESGTDVGVDLATAEGRLMKAKFSLQAVP